MFCSHHVNVEDGHTGKKATGSLGLETLSIPTMEKFCLLMLGGAKVFPTGHFYSNSGYICLLYLFSSGDNYTTQTNMVRISQQDDHSSTRLREKSFNCTGIQTRTFHDAFSRQGILPSLQELAYRKISKRDFCW